MFGEKTNYDKWKAVPFHFGIPLITFRINDSHLKSFFNRHKESMPTSLSIDFLFLIHDNSLTERPV